MARPPRRLLCGVGLVVLLVLSVACQAKATVEVRVKGDGSGDVRVSLAVDADAAKRLPPPADLVSAVDLRTAGWTISAPEVKSDGSFTLALDKSFSNVAQANQLLGQLSGPDGPFVGLHLSRAKGFSSTRWRLTGSVDLSKGADTFGDAGLIAALGNRSLASLVQSLARPGDPPVAAAVHLQFVADLPGAARSVPAAHLGDPAHAFVLTSTQHRPWAVWFVVLALVALVLFVVSLGWAIRGKPRGRHARPRGRARR